MDFKNACEKNELSELLKIGMLLLIYVLSTVALFFLIH